MKTKLLLNLVFVSMLSGIIAPTIHAATLRWDGSVSAYWGTGANWDTGTVPQDGDDLVFPSGPTRLATTNNTSSTRRYNSITISGANYSLRGNSLTLSNGITATYGAGSSASVELDVTLAQGQTFDCTTANSILYITGDIVLGATTLLADATGNMLFGGAISGTGGLSKYGSGSLRLYGATANTYTGTTRVNVGTLEFNKTSGVNALAGDLVVGNNTGDPETARWLTGSQLPSTTDVTVNDGALLDLNNFSEALGALTLNGGEVQTGTGLLTLGGDVTAQSGAAITDYASVSGRLSLGSVTRTFNVLGGGSSYEILRVYASVSGTGGLIKAGAGSLGLYSSNSYAGPTTLEGGWLCVLDSWALGSTAAGTTVYSSSSGLILAYNSHVGEESLTFEGSCFWDIGGSAPDQPSWAGSVTLNGQCRIYVVPDVTLDLSGVVAGPGGLTKTSGGTLRLSGTSGNTYAGDTIVEEGTLELGKTAGAGVAIRDGNLIIGNGVGGANADVVRFTANNQLWSTVPISITNSGRLDLNGFSDTVGPLTIAGGRATSGAGGLLYLSGTVTSLGAASGCSAIEGSIYLPSTRTFDVANSSCSPDLNMTAAINGPGGITKAGGGALGLYASNSFNGVLTVNDGLVYLYHDAAPGATAGATVVNDGGVLVLANDRHVGVEPLMLNGNGDGTSGALASIGGSNSWAGAITLATDSVITVQTNRSLNLTGLVTGPGGFIKKQPGTLILSGAAANNFAGHTIVNEGTLLLDKAGTDGALSGPGNLTIGDGLGGPEADVVRELRNSQIDASVNITVNHSGLLDLNDHSEVVGGLSLYSGRIETGTGTLTLSEDVQATAVTNRAASIQGHLFVGSFTRTFNVPNGGWSPDVRIAAQVSGAADILVTGGGGLMLEASNTISGAITVADGALLWVAHAWACGSTNAGTVVSDGARLGFDGDVHVAGEALTMDSAYSLSALWVENGSNSWAGPITLARDTAVGFFSDHNPTLNLAGAVSGPGGLIKNGAGTLVLSGPTANTFAGNAVVNEGTLLLDKTPTDGALPGPGDLIIGDGIGGRGADVVRELRDFQIEESVDITVNGSGLLDLNDQSDSVGGLNLFAGQVNTGTGTLTLGGNVTARSVVGVSQALIYGHLSLGNATRTFTITSVVGATTPQLQIMAEVSGPGGLTKSGDGALALKGTNTYSGLTTVVDGELCVLNDSALGSTAAGTIVQPGACLWVGGFATSTSVHVGVEPLTLSGCLAGGALSTPATSNSWAGPITLATNATVSVADEDDYLNLTGPISGPGGLTKGDYPRPNVGTLILSGADANTYAGDTIVGEGTLVLDKSTMDGAVPANLIVCDATHYGTGAGFLRLERDNQIANTADVVVSGSGRLDLNGHYDRVNAVTGNGAVTLGAGHLLAGHSGSSFTFDGLVSGTGYLWKVGSGTWTLTANNTYSGTTRIETGTLRINGSQSVSDVLIQSQGTLGGTGTVGRVTSTGGLLSPGVSPGTLTSSNVLFDSASDFLIELTDAGADQLNVRGKVGLANASFVLSAPGLLPTEGQQFVIVSNDDTDAFTGTFAGLPEGALVPAGPRQFRITYAGGSGNDVVLIATNTAALRPTLSVWRTSTNTVVVSWPQSDIAWLLHATTNLAALPISWTEVPPPYQTNGPDFQFIESAPLGHKFYRLSGP